MKKKAQTSTKKSSVHKTKVKKAQIKTKPHSNKATTAQARRASRGSTVQTTIQMVAEKIATLFSSKPKSLVAAIKMDHAGLRNYLDILKDTDREMTERKRAYDHFVALLQSHSRVEEKIAYESANALPGYDMHIKVAEGYVEHKLADTLMSEIDRTSDPIEWSAHTNVLAEIVKHHLDEEERTVLPRFQKAFPPKLDQELLEDYLKLRAETQKPTTKENAGVLAQ